MVDAILARHGETEISLRGLTSGIVANGGGLTDLGVEQARALGRLLAGEDLDLCVTSEFRRAQQTAEIALDGRDVPKLVLPELNDICFGMFEGKPLEEYRAWARSHDPTVECPGGGESRAGAVIRFVRAFRTILGRPERRILVVAHGLPIRYALNAADERDPEPVVEHVEYARPYRLTAEDLRRAADRLEAWARAPAWATNPGEH